MAERIELCYPTERMEEARRLREPLPGDWVPPAVVAPGTPVADLETMVAAAVEYGRPPASGQRPV